MRQRYFEYGDSGPIIIWCTFNHHKDEGTDDILLTEKCIRQMNSDKSYTLLAFEVEDWNTQLSPWAAEVSGGLFSGKGAETVSYIRDVIMPDVRAKYGLKTEDVEKYGFNRKIYIIGYSLAGLFALWSLNYLEVHGAASCSGSLWYPGFVESLADTPAVTGKNIYLSLGDKEAKTRNKIMATVQENTETIYKWLSVDNNVIFESNAGGHFKETEIRIARAVRWLLEQS